MGWLNIIGPLVGVALGWGLSEYGKVWASKKEDKKKLKRLVFYLLELRFIFSREFSMEKEIATYLSIVQQKISVEFGVDSEAEIKNLLPFLKETLKKVIGNENNSDEIEKRIDQTILDLADIYPVFAYELSDQYRIKDRFKSIDKYFEEVDEYIREAPFDIKNWIQPKITQDFINEFDSNLKRIAEKINSKTKKDVIEKIKIQDSVSYDLGIIDLVGDYINQIKKSI